MKDSAVEEIMSQDEILNHLKEQEDNEITSNFKHMIAHEDPLKTTDPSCNRSICNLIIE